MFKKGFVFSGLLLLSSVTNAAFVNPDPTKYGNQIDSQLFYPASLSEFTVTEIVDVGGALSSSIFGFYFPGTDLSNPANVIPILGLTGHNTSPPQSFLVNLNGSPTPFVFNIDKGMVQSTFPQHNESQIGFYYELPKLNNLTEYSQNSLNRNGVDDFGFFPFLNSPNSYLVEVNVPKLNGTPVTLAFELTANLVPVPEPSSLALIMSGLLLLTSKKRYIFAEKK